MYHFSQFDPKSKVVLSSCYLMPSHWVVAQFIQVDQKAKMEFVYLFLRCWRLHHNRDMHNALKFDDKHELEAYLRKLKGLLI